MKQKLKISFCIVIGLITIFLSFHWINALIYDIAMGAVQPWHAFIIIVLWMLLFSTVLGLSTILAFSIVWFISWLFNW